MEKRVNKYLSEAGFCSRREADRLIEAGKVMINDNPVEIGQKVQDGDIVKVDNKIVTQKNKFVYLALNKPIGITSTTDQTDPNNIVDFMKYPARIFHVGRLDKDSEGLILMTNDGDIVNKILRSGNNHEKEYLVKVDQPLTSQFIRAMSTGVPILKSITKPCKVEYVDEYIFRIVLTEGLNRQIRRMCNHFGYHVVKLKRVRIMHIPLDVKSGKWRYLTNIEISTLKELVEASSKTEEASAKDKSI